MKKIFLQLFLFAFLSALTAPLRAINQVEGIYQLGTPQDLLEFASMVNSGSTSAAAALTADIDMKDIPWTGMSDYIGTFDGREHTISNLSAPLFSLTRSGAAVKNLTLEGEILREENVSNFGAFIADHQGNALTFENCRNKTKVTAHDAENIGGMIGRIHANNATNSNNALSITFTNCHNEAPITGKSYAGGLVGMQGNYSAELCIVFRNCSNTADILAHVTKAGGLLGASWGRCETYDSFNTGNITGEGTATRDGSNMGNYEGFVGGLMGGSHRGMEIFERCYNTGNIKGGYFVGGIIGGETWTSSWAYYLNVTSCWNVGEVEGTKYVGGLVGLHRGSSSSSYQATFVDCYNKGNVTGNQSAGLVGETRGFASSNCFNTGTITGNSESRAICGWINNSGTMKNTWNIGELVINYTDDESPITGETLYRSSVTVQNSYDLANLDFEPTHGRPEGYEDEWMANGHLASFLNTKANETVFYQTIGTDENPYPSSDGHLPVYQNGQLQCDGTPVEGAPVTYSNSPAEVPDHVYGENGLCQNCHKYGVTPEQDADGVYQITNAGNIVQFAHIVNGGETKAKAVITAPIDLEGAVCQPIGSDVNRYAGTFDGRLYPITNVSCMLFGTVGAATIRNVALESGHIDNVLNTYYAAHCGTIVGVAKANATISHCYSKVSMSSNGSNGDMGGLAGKFRGTISNSYYVGAISGEAGSSGGLIGSGTSTSATANMQNCFSIADYSGYTGTNGGALVGWHYANSKATNCVYQIAENVSAFGYDGGTGPGTVGMEGEGMANGAAVWKLNDNSFVDAVFYQTINEDPYPIFDSTHGLVFSSAEEGYISITDDNMAPLIRAIQQQGEDFLNNNPSFEDGELIAQQSLIDAFVATHDGLSDIDRRDSLIAAYKDIQNQKKTLQECAEAYVLYKTRVAEIQAEANDGSLLPEGLITLNGYYAEGNPSETYPNGTYAYIIGNRLLDKEGITNEIAFVENLYSQALKAGYTEGANITLLLQNPFFHDAMDKGWEGTMATGKATYTLYNSVDSIQAAYFTGVESYSELPFDMHQTLSDLKGGLYLLRMNAAQRPSTSIDTQSLNYTAQLYANDNNTYIGAAIEFPVMADEAVDGITANLSGTYPDYDIVVDDQDAYMVHGTNSMAVAANAGRCFNYILAQVPEGGSLTVGIRNLGSSQGNDWTGFANTNLVYLGSIDSETAGNGLDQVLEGQVARANTILYEYRQSSGMDYQVYPNFSQELRTQMENTIFEVSQATDNAAKYELVQRFSDLFNHVHSCKRVYIDLLRQTDVVMNIAMQMYSAVDEDTYNAFTELFDDLQYGYEDGTYTEEEAKNVLNTELTQNYIPEKDEDGTYLIANREQMVYLSSETQALGVSPNVKLTADIDMKDVTYIGIGQSSTPYRGTFDGQGHTFSNLVISRLSESGVGLFNNVATGSTIRNFILDSSCSISALSNVGIIGAVTSDSGTLRIEQVGNEGNVSAEEDNAGSIVGRCALRAMAQMSDCYSVGHVANTKGTSGALVGWYGVNNSMTNCWSASEVDNPTENKYLASYEACAFTNCFEPTAPADAAKLGSGEITWALNGNDFYNPVWRQTLGTDPTPHLFSGDVVYRSNGTYANEQPTMEMNAYAYELNTASTAEAATISYTLNANAKAGQINFYAGGSKVYSETLSAEDLTIGEHSVEVENAKLGEAGTEVSYDIEVTSYGVTDPYRIPLSATQPGYVVNATRSMAFNDNPESKGFGTLYVTEPKLGRDVSNSISVEKLTGIYAFDPQFAPINAADGIPGFQGGLDLATGGVAVYSGNAMYDPKTVHMTADGRLFIGRMGGRTDSPLYEANPDNLDEPWNPVFAGGRLDSLSGITYVGEEIQSGQMAAFTTSGTGDDLKLWALMAGRSDGQANAADYFAYRYDLGSQTQFTGVPTEKIDLLTGQWSTTSTALTLAADNQGGLWYINGDGNPSETKPALVHINADGEVDYRDQVNAMGHGALYVSRDGSLLAYPTSGDNRMQICSVNYAPMADGRIDVQSQFSVSLGFRPSAAVFDYAGNLFVASYTGHVLNRYVLPSTDAVRTVTPSSSRANFIVGSETGIDEMTTDNRRQTTVIYDLQGRRLTNVRKGVNILGGKKVMVK